MSYWCSWHLESSKHVSIPKKAQSKRLNSVTSYIQKHIHFLQRIFLVKVINLKIQVVVLNMIALMSWNRSSLALEVVLKKFSSIVLGIACSSFVGINNASTNAFLDLHILSQLLVSFSLSLLLYGEERYTFTTYFKF